MMAAAEAFLHLVLLWQLRRHLQRLNGNCNSTYESTWTWLLIFPCLARRYSNFPAFLICQSLIVQQLTFAKGRPVLRAKHRLLFLFLSSQPSTTYFLWNFCSSQLQFTWLLPMVESRSISIQILGIPNGALAQLLLEVLNAVQDWAAI